MALTWPVLFPSVVLNYTVFLGQALVSSHCNDFLIICLYVMNEMEMYHHGQTGLVPCQAATPQLEWRLAERYATTQIILACNTEVTPAACATATKKSCTMCFFVCFFVILLLVADCVNQKFKVIKWLIKSQKSGVCRILTFDLCESLPVWKKRKN